MARRSKQQSSAIDEVFAFLRAAPVWAGPIVAVLAYGACRWAFPWILSTTTSESEFANGVSQPISMFLFRFAPFAGAGVLLIWLAAESSKWMDRRRFEQQSGSSSINDLSWQVFESLLAEAFRRQGFVVEHTGRDGPDGGIDIRLGKAGAVTLVQCKHWKRQQVGVRIVREMLGVVSSEGAQSGIVVTSGQFTAEATDFAAKNPIRLIDGRELVRMIADLQESGRVQDRGSETAPAAAPSPHAAPMVCPQCGAPLVKKLAKRGARMGSAFFGCSTFPSCRYTRDIA